MDRTKAMIELVIAAEIGAKQEQVEAAVELLDGGATVPFIARYRKEVTGGLDDTQLRDLEARLSYLRELEARRVVVLKSIDEQGKLTDEIRGQIVGAGTKTELEDLYLPFRPKRRTRAEIARERGLGPLADAILADRSLDPEALAASYLGDDIPDTKAALEGAREILMEKMAEHPPLVADIRRHLVANAQVKARVIDGKQAEGEKFSDYFDHTEKFDTAPSHRVLALLRARNEGIISLDIAVDENDTSPIKPVEGIVGRHFGIAMNGTSAGDKWLAGVARWAWKVRIQNHVTTDLMVAAKERADGDAITIFSRNLKDLLLAAPAGNRATMGLDPGIRTGIKVAVVDGTGKVLGTSTVYPFQPRNDVRGAQLELASLIRRFGVDLIAIGNGTGSRETDRLVAEVLAQLPAGPKPTKVIVSEAGASIYSASELAANEFPDLDVSLRGAVSIARRLQDPLAELVKIEPKAIGVGQYQHDVNQDRLGKALDAVVEDAVNAVGVDLNTASAPLLARVSGVGPALASAIVAKRDADGPYRSRKELMKVPRLGAKAFEQCAGFLRVRDGTEPLDASAVHPESYAVARKVVSATGRTVEDLMRNPAPLKAIDLHRFVEEGIGLPTLKDIVAELEKPGRDPRPAFVTATLSDTVHEISDLKPGMMLEGTVTNVAAFGAFVDIGVHQDGLVHVSQIADRFVKDPSDIVKAGQVVTVKVLEVDAPRKRISLSMRKDAEIPAPGERKADAPRPARQPRQMQSRPAPAGNPAVGGFGAALAEAMKQKSGR